MLRIDNVGVMKGALDEICENELAAIRNSTCEKLRQKVNYQTWKTMLKCKRETYNKT